jgi:hypothetical protein
MCIFLTFADFISEMMRISVGNIGFEGRCGPAYYYVFFTYKWLAPELGAVDYKFILPMRGTCSRGIVAAASSIDGRGVNILGHGSRCGAARLSKSQFLLRYYAPAPQ